jgi:hypothetical protein
VSALPASLAAGPREVSPRLPWRTAMVAGFVVTLLRPATWVVALAGFLAGGGVIVLAWPIVVLPTPSGLQNMLGAPVSTLAFGSPSAELLTTIVTAVVVSAALLAAGLVMGAWAERRSVVLVLEAAADEGYAERARSLDGAPGTLRVAALRLLALLPPLAVFAIALPTVYDVTYHELILPEDLATPLPIRVIAQVPLQLAAIAVAWLLSDAAAAVGVRRMVLERRSLAASWALGWADLARRPHRIVITALLGDAALVIALAPALAAAAVAWVRVRETLQLSPDSPIGIVVVALWVAIWLGCVALAGVGAAIRAALWTLEGARRR